MLAAGPIVEALAGAITGAALAGGAMAGDAALTEFSSALRRIGIPDEQLEQIHTHVTEGDTLVILHCKTEQSEGCLTQMRWAGADSAMALPLQY